MSKPTVLITYWDIGGRVHEDGVKLLRAKGIEVKINARKQFYNEQELTDAIKGVDGVLAGPLDQFTRNVFDAADRLKVVSLHGVGYDNVDVDAATKNGVCVTLTPIPEHAKSVADATFTLILSSLRSIPMLNRIARTDNWSGDQYVGFVHDAFGKRLGIIGAGRIGAEVARRAKGFDMDVVYYDIIRKENLEKELGITYLTLEDLLRSSDIITINVALTPQSRHMIGDKEFAMMKKGVFLVNMSRGAVLDECALYEALRSGRVAGAGLDVLEKEPPSADNPLLQFENVVLTPHAGASYEDFRAMTMANCEDIVRVLSGTKPKYILNQDVLNKINLS